MTRSPSTPPITTTPIHVEYRPITVFIRPLILLGVLLLLTYWRVLVCAAGGALARDLHNPPEATNEKRKNANRNQVSGS
jgi:hypothetical protein